MMQKSNNLIVLVVLIILFSGFASSSGIFSAQGDGEYNINSIRGEKVSIYGLGVYQHMSSDVAIQGIAQDYVTLFIGIPLLLIGLVLSLKNSLRAKIFLTGIVGYFFVTYLFYMSMAMYNYLFLVYVVLLSLSFFALISLLLSFDTLALKESFESEKPIRFTAKFLIFNGCAIALLWLSIIVPPLLEGKIYPVELQHYTTLIVQGMDLGLLLPIALVSAILLLKQKPLAYLLVPVYSIFLSVLMLALTAKLIAMGLQGQSIIPAIFIIPLFAMLAIGSSVATLRKIRN